MVGVRNNTVRAVAGRMGFAFCERIEEARTVAAGHPFVNGELACGAMKQRARIPLRSVWE